MTIDDELEQMCSTTLANHTPLYWVEKKKSKYKRRDYYCARWCTTKSSLVGPFYKHLIKW